jgi:Uma2 family endonuclease
MARMSDTRRITRITTADELLRMPRDGLRRELVRGELRTMTPAGSEHSNISIELGAELRNYVKTAGLGRVFGEQAGFRLTAHPDTVRAPDAAFVSRERVEAVGLPKGYWPGAPDLAAEVISPTDSSRMVKEKVSEWLAFGTRMVLVLDPDDRTVTVHRSGQQPRVLGPDDVIDGEDVVPGWRCLVRALFPN